MTRVISFLIISLFYVLGNAQDVEYDNSGEGFSYDYSWSGIVKWRTDGWAAGFEYAQILNLKKRRIYRFEIAEYKSPKEKKDKTPREFGNKPFVFGKQNHFFALRFMYGNKYMLAQQAKRNGVMINLVYNVGFSLGITKGYAMETCTSYTINDRGEIVCFDTDAVTYDSEVNNGFLNNVYSPRQDLSAPLAIGYAGFGAGWNRLGVYPGLAAKIAFQFDWSNRDDFIKAVEVGASIDLFYKNVPILVEEIEVDGVVKPVNGNRFYFPNVYIAMQLGKRKFK